MVYSEDELAQAAIEAAGGAEENAVYFQGLDWENRSGKWGHVATPWKDHYPNCWEDLAKVKRCSFVAVTATGIRITGTTFM